MILVPLLVCCLPPHLLPPAHRTGAADELTRAALDVIVTSCLPCHHPESTRKKAVRDWPDALDLPATLEEFVTPGDAEDSLLFLMVDDGDMPPKEWAGLDGRGNALSSAQHAALRDWIQAGAALPSAEELARARQRGADVLRQVEELGLIREAAPEDQDSPDEADPALPPEETEPSFWERLARFIGHMHTAVVHFPIAFIFGAALAEVLLALGWGTPRALAPARRFCLVLAALSSVVAAGIGWIAAESVRAEITLTRHRWLGVTCALLCLLTLIVSEKREGRGVIGPWNRRARVLVLLTAVLVAVTGHLGGVLAFGESYFRF